LTPAVFKIADNVSPINIKKVNTPLTTDNVPNPTNKPKTIDKLAKTDINDVSMMITSGVWFNAFALFLFLLRANRMPELKQKKSLMINTLNKHNKWLK
jgi:hypothetical protein